MKVGADGARRRTPFLNSMNFPDRETLLNFCLGRLNENDAAAFARRVDADADLARLVGDLRREIAEVGRGRFVENSLFSQNLSEKISSSVDAEFAKGAASTIDLDENKENTAILDSFAEKQTASPEPSAPESKTSVSDEQKSNENWKKRQKRRFAFVPKRVVAPRRPNADAFLAKKASLSAKKTSSVRPAWLADCRKLFFPPNVAFEICSIWRGDGVLDSLEPSRAPKFFGVWEDSGKDGVSGFFADSVESEKTGKWAKREAVDAAKNFAASAQAPRFSQSFGAFVCSDESFDDGETFVSGEFFVDAPDANSFCVDVETAFETDAIGVFARLSVPDFSSDASPATFEPLNAFGVAFGRSKSAPFGATIGVDAFGANEKSDIAGFSGGFFDVFVASRVDVETPFEFGTFGAFGAFGARTGAEAKNDAAAFPFGELPTENAPIFPHPIQPSEAFASQADADADADATRPEYPTFLDELNVKFAEDADVNDWTAREPGVKLENVAETLEESAVSGALNESAVSGKLEESAIGADSEIAETAEIGGILRSEFASERAAFVPQKNDDYFAVENEPDEDEIAPTISAEDRRLAELLGRAPSKFEREEYYWEPIDDEDDEINCRCEKNASPLWRAAEIVGLVATAPAVAVGRATLEIFGYYRARNLGRDGEFNRVDAPSKSPEKSGAARSSGGFSETAISIVAGMLIAIFIVFPLLKIGVVELFEVVVKSKARSIGQNFTLTSESSEADLLPFLSEQFLFPSYESVEMSGSSEYSGATADSPTESAFSASVSEPSSGSFGAIPDPIVDAATIPDVSETSFQFERAPIAPAPSLFSE